MAIWRSLNIPSKQPGSFLPPPFLILRDFIAMTQRPTDIVQALKQRLLSEAIDLKMQCTSGWSRHCLRCEIDMQRVPFCCLDLCEEFLDYGIIERHGEDAVVEAVVVEDVSKAGRDDATKTVFSNGPRCVFTRGAAAEVITC